MDFSQRLDVIKEFQKVYLEKFGEKLILDFPAMKGLRKEEKFRIRMGKIALRRNVKIREVKSFFAKCVKQHNADKRKITSSLTLGCVRNKREIKALRDFTRHAIEKKWDMNLCTRVVNRQRTGLYYYLTKK